MTTYLISRHPGAHEWLTRQGHGDAVKLSHLDSQIVKSGDTVIGTLPAHLAAELGAKGAQYIHIAIDLPATLRGKELSADEMEEHGSRLQRISAYAFENNSKEDLAETSTPSKGAIPETSRAAKLFKRCQRWFLTSIVAISLWYFAQSGKDALLKLLQDIDIVTNISGFFSHYVDVILGRPTSLDLANSLKFSTSIGSWIPAIKSLFAFFFYAIGLATVSWLVIWFSKPFFRPHISMKSGSSPRPVVIMPLSKEENLEINPSAGSEESNLYARSMSLKIDEIIFDQTLSKAHFKWQQNIRALRRHLVRGNTTNLFLLVSESSAPQFYLFRDLAVHAARSMGANVHVHRRLCDFDDYRRAEKAISELIETLIDGTALDKRVSNRDISFDVTGGTKIPSIAAAVASMNRDLEFSYVLNSYTKESPDIVVFDAEFEFVHVGSASSP